MNTGAFDSKQDGYLQHTCVLITRKMHVECGTGVTHEYRCFGVKQDLCIQHTYVLCAR